MATPRTKVVKDHPFNPKPESNTTAEDPKSSITSKASTGDDNPEVNPT